MKNIEKVGVVIGTFGNQAEWAPLVQRASASLEAQTRYPDCIVWKHADTLQHARNWGAAESDHCDWFIFLDADDELDPLYIESMLSVGAGGGDIRRPSTLGVYEDGTTDAEPVLIPEAHLDTRNYIVIGAMVWAELFFDVDGFDDYPILEDWALWLKCRNAGAKITACPAAVYKVHVRPNSRNTDESLHGNVYSQIRAAHTR